MRVRELIGNSKPQWDTVLDRKLKGESIMFCIQWIFRPRDFHCQKCAFNRSKWNQDFVEQGRIATDFRGKLRFLVRPLVFTFVVSSKKPPMHA